MQYQLDTAKHEPYFNAYHYVVVMRGMLDFDAARRWMAEAYGPSDQIVAHDNIPNPHWCFDAIYQHSLIYLKDSEELTWFELRYGPPAAGPEI